MLASYNRGMRLIHELGGVTVTVSDDAMQRAPVFGFDSAREARDFGIWVGENFSRIKEAAETSTSFGKLKNIEQYAASKFLYLRFNYTTGDAAGQNMTGKATFVACNWIQEQYASIGTIREFSLSGNMDTDKKASYIQ